MGEGFVKRIGDISNGYSSIEISLTSALIAVCFVHDVSQWQIYIFYSILIVS